MEFHKSSAKKKEQEEEEEEINEYVMSFVAPPTKFQWPHAAKEANEKQYFHLPIACLVYIYIFSMRKTAHRRPLLKVKEKTHLLMLMMKMLFAVAIYNCI